MTIQMPIKSEPVWEIATLFPEQGNWSLEEYFALDTNRLIEYSHGFIEVLPVPSIQHQRSTGYLYRELFSFVHQHRLGEVFFSPTHIQLWEGKIREPDVVFIADDRSWQHTKQFWFGADLVMEVVSPDDPKRDVQTKRREYAMAGIPEYWIIDPRSREITVLVLEGKRYVERGIFTIGDTASSQLLDGFSVDVALVFRD